MEKIEVKRARSFEEACAELGRRMRARFVEIEANLATLVERNPDPREAAQPLYSDYLASLPANRTAILEYMVDYIEGGEGLAANVPATVFTAARLAARAGVPLDTLLRRYSAGNAFVVDILIEEAARVEVTGADLRRLMHRSATLFDHLVAAVTKEHANETRNRLGGGVEWRRNHIRALLAGRMPSGELDLGYDLSGHHLGLMASGGEAREVVRELAKKLDRRLLVEQLDGEAAWSCWLGGRSRLGGAEAQRALGRINPDPVTVTLGEPGEGVAGWRLSHRQAKAALPIAKRRGEAVLRYADIAVLASILRDDLGATSLRQLYIEPLEARRDGGKAALETLRAYFATERNISSTAAALGVDRRTVRNRLRAVESLFGRPLSDFATDLETALRLVD